MFDERIDQRGDGAWQQLEVAIGQGIRRCRDCTGRMVLVYAGCARQPEVTQLVRFVIFLLVRVQILHIGAF